ncbi:hypothetical protein LTR36_004849 [Oleoguttula mirabilis]|uniref:Uncharacterized protein n=1 Tax=Oleoguttula mirabilis TaxID=1507867 RepID=A0AAV9JFJ1_9PEZI|nr:hypothetical protein LTR36_004849 [Oleoguttula mirabilis]
MPLCGVTKGFPRDLYDAYAFNSDHEQSATWLTPIRAILEDGQYQNLRCLIIDFKGVWRVHDSVLEGYLSWLASQVRSLRGLGTSVAPGSVMMRFLELVKLDIDDDSDVLWD